MNGLKKLAFFAVLCAGITANAAFADELLINSNTVIGAADFQHDGKSLIVEGATLTLSGTHSFESVVLRNSAILTTPVQAALTLNAVSVDVDASSRIDLSAKGKLPDTSLSTNYYSGGSYGGRGGHYSSSGTYYNAVGSYGDYRWPRELGTGGRGASSSSNRTYGGGALELQAESLALKGKILANGQALSYSGSGSGGALLLQVGSLTLGAQSLIQADGGGISGYSSYYGGGGGGRVALYYRSLQGDLNNRLSAKGGLTGNSDAFHGSPGTVYIRNSQNGDEQLIVSNGTVPTGKAAVTSLNLVHPMPFVGSLTAANANLSLAGELVYDSELSPKRSLSVSGG
ncbi:MAG TPA: hypothetical protein VLG17_12610, partial [Pseudomonas sp.]|nr:hypothetical protein [Pseudomonas sp.]